MLVSHCGDGVVITPPWVGHSPCWMTRWMGPHSVGTCSLATHSVNGLGDDDIASCSGVYPVGGDRGLISGM
ncbi:hypothetical protein EBZ35_01740 [bacterium]|nr:hypothetical protein [bacterium]